MSKKKQKAKPKVSRNKQKTSGEGRSRLKQKMPFFLLACALYALCVFLCTVFLLQSDKSPKMDLYYVLAFLAPAAFLSSFLIAKKEKQHGLLTGFLWTLPQHLILFGLSLLLGHGNADLTVLISFAILSLLSMLGGVCGVNQRQKMKKQLPGKKRV